MEKYKEPGADALVDSALENIHLNIHPELWLNGSIKDRINYIDEIKKNSNFLNDYYLDKEVKHIWTTHEAVR